MSSSPGSPTPARAVPRGDVAPVSAEVEALRVTHEVRPLRPEEEGRDAALLPNGVYGFTYAPGQPEVPIFSKQHYHSFEVHKTADGTEYLIGFVTPSEASDLAASKEGASIRLFPSPWQNSQSLVSVRVSVMVASKRMPREDGNPLPFTIA
ncbi:MAG TPA: hypothetical protein VKX49_11855 [Bryobacteraceae bacterium]|nr:hypothetical protein [Bryobacteraceae bacterium]